MEVQLVTFLCTLLFELGIHKVHAKTNTYLQHVHLFHLFSKLILYSIILTNLNEITRAKHAKTNKKTFK